LEKLRIIIGGFIGLYPTGGVAWDYIQYPLGLQLLGHDVYYIEDTMQYSKYQLPTEKWDDATQSIAYLKTTMELFGLGDRWAYRDIGSGACYGLSIARVEELCNSADVFMNVSAATFLRDEYLRIPKRMLIDSDPMFTQVQDWDDADPEASYDNVRDRYHWYNYHFTFGENIGKPDCLIPTLGLQWHTTRQPICLDYWKGINMSDSKHLLFTTVMNWSARNPMVYQRQPWGQKNVEFLKFISLPACFRETQFQVAMAMPQKGDQDDDIQAIKNAGWKLLPANEMVRTANAYLHFIAASSAEFSVAKEAYVKSRSGWFSCRSACYLAAGKPVVTQNTGWSKYIESGKGLFAFDDFSSGIEAIKEVTGNIACHSRAARVIAQEYFDSNKVLKQLLETVASNHDQ
jgi:hypothetical protein